MPTSDYLGFEVLVDNDDGTTTPLASQTVSIYDVTNDAALSDITSDANGHVDAGTLPVAAGTAVRFHTALDNGQCGYKEEVTT
jgi:hypothetical protein